MGSIDSYPAPFGSSNNAVLGYSLKSANQTGVTAEVDVTDLSVTVSVPTGRTIRISTTGLLDATVNTEAVVVRINEGATILQSAIIPITMAGQGIPCNMFAIASPSAGTHTYKVRFGRVVGTGTVSFLSNPANNPAYILVEDITGGTGGPGPIQLGYAQTVIAQTGITTGAAVDLTGLAVTVSVPAGRTLRIRGQAMFQNMAAGANYVQLYILEGAGALNDAVMNFGATGTNQQYGTATVEVISTPTAGVHTYKLQASASAASINTLASAIRAPFIVVEDITGTNAPGSPQPSSQTLGYALSTTTQAGITTEVPLTGLNVTVSVPDGRRIRISARGEFTRTVVDGTSRMFIKEGATILQTTDIQPKIAGDTLAAYDSVIVTPTAGTHTYNLSLMIITGTGTTAIVAGGTVPAYLLVEDVTGNSPAYPAVNVPVGQLAYAELTANQTVTYGSEVALNGMSVNVAVPAGRTLRITAQVTIGPATASKANWIAIKEGGTTLKYALVHNVDTNEITLVDICILSPTAGTHTYFVALNGTGTTALADAGTDRRCFILVEDITATPASTTGAPSSTLAYSEVTTSQGSITAAVDLTGLSATVTVPAGRRIRVSAKTLPSTTQTGDTGDLYIMEGATQLAFSREALNQAANGFDLQASVVLSPSAGTHTYKLQMGRQGTGTVTANASATIPSFILVEDITGSVWPAGSQVTSGIIASEAWIPYTPAWTSSGTAPALGNGSLSGRYIKIGRTVIGAIYFAAGSTTTFGTGNYFWSLPFAPSNVLFLYQNIGSGKGYSGGNNINTIATINNGTTTVRLVYSATWPAGTETLVGQTTPWTWATGNDITIQFTYESST